MKKRFEQIYQEYRDVVYGYLYYMVRDIQTAEDLSQETFLKIYLGLRRFKGQCSEKTWCLTIARNTFLSWIRKKSPETIEKSELEEIPAAQESQPEQFLVSQEKNREIMEVLFSLSHDDRTVLLLRDYEGLSYAEIASVMNLSEVVVKGRIYRARERYRMVYGKKVEQHVM